MSYQSVPLLAGVAFQLDIPGQLILIDSLGAASGVDVQIVRNGTPDKKMPNRKVAFRHVGAFDAVVLCSAVDTTVGVFLSFDDVQLGVSDGASVAVPNGVTVTNAVGAPIPVIFTGVVAPVLGTINNTDAQAVPVVQKVGTIFTVEQATEVDTRPYLAAVVSNVAPVAVTAAVGALIAVGATRRGARFKNVGANAVAIGGAALVYANAATLIQPGETWNENEAPGAAWYCICDTGLASTINIQTIT